MSMHQTTWPLSKQRDQSVRPTLSVSITLPWTLNQSHPAISLTSAAQNDRVFMVDAVTVMQFSPRTPKAAGLLAAEIKARLDGADGS